MSMEEDEKKGGEDGEKHNILAGIQSPVHVPEKYYLLSVLVLVLGCFNSTILCTP